MLYWWMQAKNSKIQDFIFYAISKKHILNFVIQDLIQHFLKSIKNLFQTVRCFDWMVFEVRNNLHFPFLTFELMNFKKYIMMEKKIRKLLKIIVIGFQLKSN